MIRKSLGVLAIAAVTLAILVAVPIWLLAQEADRPDDESEPRAHATWRHDCDGECSRGYLGVELRTLTPELQKHFGAPGGVLIAAVTEDSPAAAAGLRVGDVLTEIDGARVDSARELGRAIRRRPGETVTVELVRDRQPLQLEATLGEHRAHDPRGFELDFDAERWAEMGEHWAEMGEHWGQWGAEMGERWGQWGAEMGERWGRWGEEMGRRWAERGEDWGRRGEDWGEHWEEMGAELGALGAEIGLEVARAMEEMDWDEFNAALEESMTALESIDWDAIHEDLERGLESMDEELEQSLEEMERRLEEMERRLEKETAG